MHGVTVECCMIIRSWLSQCEDFGFSMDGPVPDVQQGVDDADIPLPESSTVAQRDNDEDEVEHGDDFFDVDQDLTCMEEENGVLEPGGEPLGFSQSTLAESELADYLL